jgi:hypothetical protein
MAASMAGNTSSPVRSHLQALRVASNVITLILFCGSIKGNWGHCSNVPPFYHTVSKEIQNHDLTVQGKSGNILILLQPIVAYTENRQIRDDHTTRKREWALV